MSVNVYPTKKAGVISGDLVDDFEVLDSLQLRLYDPESTYTFSPFIIEQTGFDFSSETQIEIGGPPANVLEGVFEYSDNVYTCDIGVNSIKPPLTEGGDPTITRATIELLDYDSDSPAHFAVQKNSNTINISGKAVSVFTDQMFEFLMPDKKIKILPANTQETYLALTSWAPPGITEKSIEHTLTLRITYFDDYLSKQRQAIQVFTLQQKVRWRFDSGIKSFRELLSKGTI